MSAPRQKWLRGLQSTSLFRPAPLNANQKHTEVLAYVELFAQFVSESFVDDIGELVRSHYPSQENCLLDDVLAIFVLHHPEHGHAVLHALLSCVIDGTILYEKNSAPFGAFISLFSPSTEREFSEQWALACGEILRVLTHYNRPTFKTDNGQPFSSLASPSTNGEGSGKATQEDSALGNRGRKSPDRLLTRWITDSLLAASPPIRNDYFRWCGGIMGKYAGGEELRPPTTVGQGKQPQLLPSSPRWAVANGPAVILSVCDDEASRYETADLTASAVPALLIRPPSPDIQDEQMVVLSLPPLEPYGRLFHRYYVIATPGATERLLLGLLEAPPVGAPHGLLVAVELLEILRVADESSSSYKLSRDWLHRHFLKPVGTAMSTRSGFVADAAAALLYHIFSQPALLVPRLSRSRGSSAAQSLYGCATLLSGTEEAKTLAYQANDEETAGGLAALLVGHGPDVEWRICLLWEAALGLRPLSPQVLDLPKFVLSAPLQPPVLSWNMVRPLLCTLEYLPAKSESRDCLRRIFSGTVEAILQRTFPREEVAKQMDGSYRNMNAGGSGPNAKAVGMAELRAMVHCLFTEPFLSPNLAAQLLSDALTLCLSHDAKREIELKAAARDRQGRRLSTVGGERPSSSKEIDRHSGDEAGKNRGAVATFDSYIVAAVCALACEVRLLSVSPAYFTVSEQAPLAMATTEGDRQVGSSGRQDGRRSSSASRDGFPIGIASVAEHTKRLGLLELLLVGSPSSSGTGNSDNTTSNNILGESVVAAHMSNLLGQSKACLHSLTEIMKCEWDPGICAQAAALLSRIESNSGLMYVSSQGRRLHARSYGVKSKDTESGSETVVSDSDHTSKAFSLDSHKDSTVQKSPNRGRMTNLLNGHRQKSPNGFARGHMGKQVVTLALEAADVASLLCKERTENGAALTASLQSVIIEKQHLAIGTVALLCQRLVFSPEIPNSTEGTSAERGWHQVVEALCKIAAAVPEEVAPFIVAQAEKQLQPWTGKDPVQSQKSVWRVNIRIVSLLSALLRLWAIPFIVKEVLRDGVLLRRATDGMTIDGEACTLPQLELLEAAAQAAQAALKWDEPLEQIADMLLSLLRDRLPVTVQCLSHSSAHVRAMSIARLREMLYFESFRTRYSKEGSKEGDSREKNGDTGTYHWRRAIEQCLTWEAHYRRAGGMSISLLANAATALGCTLPS
ncbi:unnamed protein product [Calypogeia fissa]